MVSVGQGHTGADDTGATTRYRLAVASLVFAALSALLVVPAMATDIPESPHGTSEIACTYCHSEAQWVPLLDPLPFDHGTTHFELNGSHQETACRGCHESLVFSEAETQCASCHQSDFEAATEPDHAGLSNACESCHGENGWQPATFDHNLTGFLLQGSHRTADCASCHADGYAGTPSACFSCHESDYVGASEPDHSGFPTACESCHGENGWQPATFDHNQTGFI
ncbi:MAG: cytochrome c3 family protein, partial [Thermoanaerobaculia bacterium]|nr:cytochrome c3 family protein [Thermoanaerobaculia bacterium]